MEKLIDKYFWVARVAVGIIVALPLILAFFMGMPDFYTALGTFYGKTGISTALLILSGLLVRHMGKRIEPCIRKQWGGPPTTRLLRWSDGTRTEQWKRRIHEKVLHLTGIKLLGPTEESEKPRDADSLIADVTNVLKSRIRNLKEAYLVRNANIEYGFARNLLGSRWLWLLSCVLGIALSCVGMGNGVASASWGLVCCVALLIAAGIIGLAVLPRQTKEIADRYAEEFWAVVANMDAKGVGKEGNNG